MIDFRVESIDVRQDNASHQPLDGPAILHEFQGEMIKQLGVRRCVSRFAKIVNRSHQAFAEQPIPNPIDHQSGGQWMGCIDQPVGEFQPAARFWWDFRKRTRQRDLQNSARDQRALVVRHATNGQMNVARRVLFDRCHRRFPLGGLCLQRLDLLLEFGNLLPDL